jgi:hypothetical protein
MAFGSRPLFGRAQGPEPLTDVGPKPGDNRLGPGIRRACSTGCRRDKVLSLKLIGGDAVWAISTVEFPTSGFRNGSPPLDLKQPIHRNSKGRL